MEKHIYHETEGNVTVRSLGGMRKDLKSRIGESHSLGVNTGSRGRRGASWLHLTISTAFFILATATVQTNDFLGQDARSSWGPSLALTQFLGGGRMGRECQEPHLAETYFPKWFALLCCSWGDHPLRRKRDILKPQPSSQIPFSLPAFTSSNSTWSLENVLTSC